jgi:hypothetical protein
MHLTELVAYYNLHDIILSNKCGCLFICINIEYLLAIYKVIKHEVKSQAHKKLH